MNGTTLIAIVIIASLASSAAGYAVFKSFGVEMRRRHLEVGTAVFLQLGVIYAVFLAFVFGQALTSFVAADDAIDTECAALHGAAILATTLPKPAAARMKTALDDYIKEVIGSEWTTMRETRQASETAIARQETLIRTAGSLGVAEARQIATQDRIVALLLDAHKSREERIFEAGQGIPAGLWAMILVYCGVLVGLVFFASLELAASHAVISGVFGGLNALILLAVFALQYPFEGPFRIAPNTFVTTQVKSQRHSLTYLESFARRCRVPPLSLQGGSSRSSS